MYWHASVTIPPSLEILGGYNYYESPGARYSPAIISSSKMCPFRRGHSLFCLPPAFLWNCYPPQKQINRAANRPENACVKKRPSLLGCYTRSAVAINTICGSWEGEKVAQLICVRRRLPYRFPSQCNGSDITSRAYPQENLTMAADRSSRPPIQVHVYRIHSTDLLVALWETHLYLEQ